MHEELRTSRLSYWPWLALAMWTKPHARPQIFVCGRGGGIRQRHTCAGRLVGQKRSFAVFLIHGKFCGENIYRRGGGGLSTPCKCALACVCKKGKSEKKEEARFLTPLELRHLGTCGGLFAFGAPPSSIKHVVDEALVSSRRRVLHAREPLHTISVPLSTKVSVAWVRSLFWRI